MMARTAWMDADETVAKGFATEISPAAPVEARHRPEAFAQLGEVPPRFRMAASALVAGRLPAASPASGRRALDDIQESYAALNQRAPAEPLVALGFCATLLALMNILARSATSGCLVIHARSGPGFRHLLLPVAPEGPALRVA